MEEAADAHAAIADIRRRANASIIGQERVVERLVIALPAHGNMLLEGLPGLAKTRAIKSLSPALMRGRSPVLSSASSSQALRRSA